VIGRDTLGIQENTILKVNISTNAAVTVGMLGVSDTKIDPGVQGIPELSHLHGL